MPIAGRRHKRSSESSRGQPARSASVYANHGPLGQDENAPLLPPLESEAMETYGDAKAACEKAVLDGLGAERCMVARMGLIGGPGDISCRTGYWPMRSATWLVQNCEKQLIGIYNATGETHSFAGHMAAAREVAGHQGQLAAADAEWLHGHGVGEWAGPKSLPLWLSDPEWQGRNARAKDAELVPHWNAVAGLID